MVYDGRGSLCDMRMFNFLRIYGHGQIVVGHFVLLYVSMLWGLVLCVMANLLIFPWAIRERLWDVVVIMCFFTVIEGTKLASMVL